MKELIIKIVIVIGVNFAIYFFVKRLYSRVNNKAYIICTLAAIILGMLVDRMLFMFGGVTETLAIIMPIVIVLAVIFAYYVFEKNK